MRNVRQQGYILILTLMLLGLCMSIVTFIFIRGQQHMFYLKSMVRREKARNLAQSGIQLALSQLTQPALDQDVSADNKKALNAEGQARYQLARILPALNCWQRFSLKEAVDGIDGEIAFCIMAEEGKCNINQWYDFAAHKFKGEGQPSGDMKKVVQTICELLQKKSGKTGLFDALTAFLKKRSYPLDDATELLMIPAFSFFKHDVFYIPPVAADGAVEKRPVFLTDLFTTWSESELLQPWLLSDSVAALFELKRAVPDEVERRMRSTKEWLKNFSLKTDWPAQWNKLLQPIYGKDFTSLPKCIHSILDPSFDPTVFSVRVQATVDGITQSVYAIVQCTQRSDGDAVSYSGIIKRIYWL